MSNRVSSDALLGDPPAIGADVFLDIARRCFYVAFTFVILFFFLESKITFASGDKRPVRLADCHPTALGIDARCGFVDVPENWTRTSGRHIKLRVVVVPAETPNAAPDPIFVLAGGPGQAATEQTWVIRYFAFLRTARNLVLVDQRGTGKSNPLDCHLGTDDNVSGYFTELYPRQLIAKCRQALESHADLRQYTTTASAEDLDAVRQAIGANRINVYGTSYGTRLALEYLRRFPTRVRTLILDGVIGPQMRAPQTFGVDAQRALDLLVNACAEDSSCRTAYPNLATEFSNLKARWRHKPVTAVVRAGPGAPPQHVEFNFGLGAYTIRSLLYNTSTAARLPFLIHAAARGDFNPLAQLRLALGRALDKQLALGLFLSVTCTEDDAPLLGDRLQLLTSKTFIGDYLIREQHAACAQWPHGTAPPDFHDLVRSNVPALLLSGWLDPVTPPLRSDAQAHAMSHAARAIAMQGAHAFEWPQCLDRVIARLVATGSPIHVEPACLSQIARPPFVTK
jgi:pimeloyl-ACP methyl ester carboxylesterase